jgi:hypothetical protein
MIDAAIIDSADGAAIVTGCISTWFCPSLGGRSKRIGKGQS